MTNCSLNDLEQYLQKESLKVIKENTGEKVPWDDTKPLCSLDMVEKVMRDLK